MYDGTNEQAQWILRHVVRSFMWEGGGGEEGGGGGGGVGGRDCVLCTISCDYILFDGVYPVGSARAKSMWGQTKQMCIPPRRSFPNHK